MLVGKAGALKYIIEYTCIVKMPYVFHYCCRILRNEAIFFTSLYVYFLY